MESKYTITVKENPGRYNLDLDYKTYDEVNKVYVANAKRYAEELAEKVNIKFTCSIILKLDGKILKQITIKN